MSKKEDTNFYRIERLDKEQELAAALGNMVIAWSFAEQALMNAMARVTGLPLNIILNGYYRIPTINSRMQFLIGLLEHWKLDGFDAAAISAHILGLAKLSATRNHWIHNEWCRGEHTHQIVQFDQRAKIGSPARRKEIKAADILNHNEAVLARCKEIDRLVKSNELAID
ncbi:hypothetical protein [Bradyrhizobium sp. CCBAU 11361]|uniref:hypothetical protein n=1 Tax=Bradyrhizobium sp. CCBAU 11361 TaxID=1630812 RepID=UPI002306A2C1|nr:hypothetical protein [Bradyrhizobium sp. CCBAU 11361]